VGVTRRVPPEAGPGQQPGHPVVVEPDLGQDGGEPALGCNRQQQVDQEGAEALGLHVISHHDRHLGLLRLVGIAVETRVGGHLARFAAAPKRHEGQAVDEVNVSHPGQQLRAQRRHVGEVAQPAAALAEPVIEALEDGRVTGLDRTHKQGRPFTRAEEAPDDPRPPAAQAPDRIQSRLRSGIRWEDRDALLAPRPSHRRRDVEVAGGQGADHPGGPAQERAASALR